MLSPDNFRLLQLCELLGPDFASQLAALVNRVGVTQAAVRVEADVCSTGGDQVGSVVVGPLPPYDRLITHRLPKGYLDLHFARQGNPTPVSLPGAQVRRDFLQLLPWLSSELRLSLHLQMSPRTHHFPLLIKPTSAPYPTVPE
jgi:hypothetical protein